MVSDPTSILPPPLPFDLRKQLFDGQGVAHITEKGLAKDAVPPGQFFRPCFQFVIMGLSGEVQVSAFLRQEKSGGFSDSPGSARDKNETVL